MSASRALNRPVEREEPSRLDTLDSVRGIAALVVVVHHCLLTQPAFSDYFFSTWRTRPDGPVQQLLFQTPLRIVWDGFEAVTLFYVLSGLVLALPWIRGRPPTYPDYAVKRVCRIYIPYLVAVGVAAWLSASHLFRAPIAGLSDWVNEMNWSHPVTPRVLVDHVFMIGHYNTLNGVIHSLIWEMRVSLIFPFIVWPIVKWRLWGAASVTIVVTVLIAAIELWFGGDRPSLDLLVSSPELGAVGKLFLELQWTAYFCYFFIGGTLLAMYLPRIRTRMAALAGWRSIAVLAVGLLLFQAHWSRTFVVQQLMVGVGSAMIIIASIGSAPVVKVLKLPVLVWLGRISYSLYLVHVPLLMFALLVLNGRVAPVYTLIALPFAAMALAWVFQILVAEPSVVLGKRLAAMINERARARIPQSQFS